MTGLLRAARILQAGLLLLAVPVAAQVRFGGVSAKANGTISSGYTASFGNMTASSHDWAVGGVASLSGSYYNPNFLSFNATFYLDQSRANSDFQSISNASGFDLSTTIFAGSQFPGSITYSKAYNSEGNYALPGLPNYVTHGDSDTFGINWSENLTGKPSFSAGFQTGKSQYSVYGSNNEGNNHFHSLNLHSAYRLAGFNLAGYYTNGASQAMIPKVVSGLPSAQTNSASSAYGFNASSRLPMQGSFSAGVNRSNWNTNYLGAGSSGTIDLFNALAAVHPLRKLSLSVTANYSDNLSGQLVQSVIAAGGVASGANSNQTSNSFDLTSVASYAPLPDLQTSGYFERRSQSFLGRTYGVNSYGSSATYAHKLMGGTVNSALTVTANSSDNTGSDTLGFSANGNYSNLLLGWHLNGSFGYAQNVQTLIVTYMNSFYNYSGAARRHWGQFNISLGAGGSRTAITQQAGTSNSSESYNASMGYGQWATATGSFSKSNGQALITGAGLVPVPVPSPVVPSNLVSLFGGDSYSFGLSSSPAKKLILAASYARSISNTSSSTLTTANQNNQFNSLVQYQFRKLNFTSGYARLEQGFSGSATKPEIISTYYFGVSRWFNFF